MSRNSIPDSMDCLGKDLDLRKTRNSPGELAPWKQDTKALTVPLDYRE